MGWLIVAFGTVFLLIVGHIQNSQRVEVVKMQQSGSSHLLARQLLSLAAGINDWRYRHTLTNGTVALSALALPVTPDSRAGADHCSGGEWPWKRAAGHAVISGWPAKSGTDGQCGAGDVAEGEGDNTVIGHAQRRSATDVLGEEYV